MRNSHFLENMNMDTTVYYRCSIPLLLYKGEDGKFLSKI
jgi:hypothetical protein